MRDHDASGSKPDVLIIGGGLGGVAAALAACSSGATAVLVERYRWLGGQLTSQAVPLDEHPWIETHGSTANYRRLRRELRAHYARHYPLSGAARANGQLNPGNGWVSPLCVEPRVASSVIDEMLAPWVSVGRLVIHTSAVPVSASVDGDRIAEVRLRLSDGSALDIAPRFVLEATETGELLDLAGVEYRTGSEPAALTGEPSASTEMRPLNMQAVTHCFALDLVDGDQTIERPADYEKWRDSRLPGWANPLFSWTYPNPRTGEPVTARFEPNVDGGERDMESALRAPELWTYRRVLDRGNFANGFAASDVTIVNWPMNDYLDGPLFCSDDDARHQRRAKALGRALLYWMQTEAPRTGGGLGFPGLRLRPDVLGTKDGFAQAPYIRESRRIESLVTPSEQDLSVAVRQGHGAVTYADTVGTGSYRIDLHPTTGGDHYLDIAAYPFEIPLGALVPVRTRNLIAAGKTIGTTHITNGCYRVHPAEWSIGEAAGSLAAYCIRNGTEPHAVREKSAFLEEFQFNLSAQGVDLRWLRGERMPE